MGGALPSTCCRCRQIVTVPWNRQVEHGGFKFATRPKQNPQLCFWTDKICLAAIREHRVDQGHAAAWCWSAPPPVESSQNELCRAQSGQRRQVGMQRIPKKKKGSKTRRYSEGTWRIGHQRIQAAAHFLFVGGTSRRVVLEQVGPRSFLAVQVNKQQHEDVGLAQVEPCLRKYFL